MQDGVFQDLPEAQAAKPIPWPRTSNDIDPYSLTCFTIGDEMKYIGPLANLHKAAKCECEAALVHTPPRTEATGKHGSGEMGGKTRWDQAGWQAGQRRSDQAGKYDLYGRLGFTRRARELARALVCHRQAQPSASILKPPWGRA